ncbi:MAG: ABC transporter permease [Actinomyces sp.]|nr:ABC transporter permease [Actinomyces sp. HMSC035G02]MBS4874369.1 ABC transporter permease [Actinomyces sp.]MBS5722344.1 ABC transporter permease [Actinomyces sp.]MBS7071655.1 ABC transporter permease [Actinomyces sp.]
MSARASKGMGFVIQVFRIRWLVSLLAVVIAFAIGAVFIVLADASVVDAYYAMFRGSIVDLNAPNAVRMFKPLTDSLFYSIPLIISGLGLALGFRAGLFNIGGKGQIIVGALAAVWVGFSLNLPPVVHTLVALLVAIVAGGLYGGIAGVLKAKTGANEVIVTIMLNSIATLGLGYILTQKAWQVPGTNQPVTPKVAESAALARLLPAPFKLHVGFLVALLALVAFWWLIERSTLGFQIRAVGANAAAARTAGISVERITAITMVLSGAFLGLAGANEALGTIGYVSRDVAGSIGFDAITVALLGRNKTWGTFGAGLLFGAFKAGGYAMQAKGVPIDMILILQSVIVLLIAVPDALAVAVPAVRRRRVEQARKEKSDEHK